jgi:Uma2 family endonuclease
VAEWDALPEDNTRRYELAEGILQVSPRPVSNHQWAVGELVYQLRSQLPAELHPLPEIEVLLFDGFPSTVRVPDVVVVPTAVAKSNPARYPAGDVLLAVEVISPGSRTTDRVTKLNEYARAGIGHYWIVDLENPVTITAFQLADQEYERVAEATETLSVQVPALFTIDVRVLLP